MKFVRTSPAPLVSGDYSKFRSYVRSDFQEMCAYCLMEELLSSGQENFELDHFVPVSKSKSGVNDFYNLYYACHVCNHIKGAKWPDPRLSAKGIGFVDLCKDDFDDHFRELPNGEWEGLTESGKYTIAALKLNRKHLVELRVWLRALIKSASASRA